MRLLNFGTGTVSCGVSFQEVLASNSISQRDSKRDESEYVIAELTEDHDAEDTELGKTEIAVDTGEGGLSAERADALHLLEGLGDAGGAVTVGVGPGPAARAGLHPVRPVPDGTVHAVIVRGLGLGREDGGEVPEVGFVGAVSHVATTAAPPTACDDRLRLRPRGGGEGRAGQEDDQGKEGEILHDAQW